MNECLPFSGSGTIVEANFPKVGVRSDPKLGDLTDF